MVFSNDNFSFYDLSIDEQTNLLQNKFQSYMESDILKNFDKLMNAYCDNKISNKVLF